MNVTRVRESGTALDLHPIGAPRSIASRHRVSRSSANARCSVVPEPPVTAIELPVYPVFGRKSATELSNSA
ncbi:hypothetical protein GCM10023201_16220 [Actinomycetospora corticicola]|uniref:Uncharacterized protein n=1 Tax=Actinomycetospora corticicola TaxID=663602 RepID=A0A7Y9DV01_9PSEU|nr:hypothetical protein [Actinomycetospora corticicola]